MGVYVEQEYRIKRAKGTGRDPKSPKLSGRHIHASKSAFNHKVRHGTDKKAYTGRQQKKSLLKSQVQGKLPQVSKTVLITLPVMVNLRLTVMMEKVPSKQGKEKTLTGSLLQLYLKEMITPEHIVEKTSIM